MYSWKNVGIGVLSAVIVASALSWAFTPGPTPAQQVVMAAQDAAIATMGYGERFVNWMSGGAIVSTRQMIRDTNDTMFTIAAALGGAILLLGGATASGLSKKQNTIEVEAKRRVAWAKVPGAEKFNEIYDKIFGDASLRGIKTEEQALGAVGINAVNAVREEEILSYAQHLAMRSGSSSAVERLQHRIALNKSALEEFPARVIERAKDVSATAPGKRRDWKNIILRRKSKEESPAAAVQEPSSAEKELEEAAIS